VRWTGSEDGEVEITDEFDGAPEVQDADQTAGETTDQTTGEQE
jgi:hypothetical protein